MSAGEQRQAEELNTYLGCLQSGEEPPLPPDVPAAQAALLHELHDLAHTARPDPQFSQALERRLLAAAKARPAPAGWGVAIGAWLRGMDRRLALSMAAAVAVIALFLAALIAPRITAPSGQNGTRLALAPESSTLSVSPTVTARAGTVVALVATTAPTQPPAATPGEAPVDDPTATPPVPTATPEPVTPPTSVPDAVSPTPTVGMAGGLSEAPLLPPLAAAMCGGPDCDVQPAQISWTLDAALPEGPDEAPAFALREPGDLTTTTAADVAARMGVYGGIYVPSDIGRASSVSGAGLDLVAVAEPRQVAFESPDIFVYRDRSAPGSASLPADAAIAAAGAFMQASGLLDVPYQAVASGGIVSFYQLLDGLWPVHGPLARVEVGPAGEVVSVHYRGLDLEPQGAYPLLSAAEAWQRLREGQSGDQVWYRVEARPADPQTWLRIYPAGAQAHLFGQVQVLLARDGGAPHVTLGGLVLQGSVGALVEQHLAVQGRADNGGLPVHVWGQIQDAGAYRVLIVEGWEDASAQPGLWSGTLGAAGLVTGDGQTLPLPDRPAGLADGAAVSVQGGLVDGRLEWSLIQEQVASRPGCVENCSAAVEAVALVYLVPSPDALPGEQPVLQPVWWFSARSDQGDRISAYVQAVSDAHVDTALGPVPNQP